MVDTVTSAISAFRAQFTNRAELPARQLADAEKFAALLETQIREGVKPSTEAVSQGKAVLTALDGRIEDWAFAATVLVGQSATDDADLDRQIDTLIRSVEYAQQTSSRLSEMLDSASA